jgi:DNA polymerase-3 subunit epsilon
VNIYSAILMNRLARVWHGRKDLPDRAKANLHTLDDLRPKAPALSHDFVVVDLETTGLDYHKDRVVSVGAFRVRDGNVKLGEVFNELVNPGRDIPEDSILVHAIVPDMCRDARAAWEVFEDFLDFVGSSVLVAHHALVDLFFLNWVMQEQYGFRLQNLMVDTVLMCRTALIEPDFYGQRIGAKRCSLDALAERFNIHVPERHTALGDALATALIFQRLLHQLEESGWTSLADLIEVAGVR